MRVIECNVCGETISAASDDELVGRLTAHLKEEHDESADAEEIQEQCWNPRLGAYVQYPDSATLDAGALMMPLVGFTGAEDPRFVSTLERIETELVTDSLVNRYRTDGTDGFDEPEGTFNLCSFWYVEALTRAGRLDQARHTFEKMLTYANHLGLYSEEIALNGEQIGNFPQAFTHLALIDAAITLNRELELSPRAVARRRSVPAPV